MGLCPLSAGEFSGALTHGVGEGSLAGAKGGSSNMVAEECSPIIPPPRLCSRSCAPPPLIAPRILLRLYSRDVVGEGEENAGAGENADAGEATGADAVFGAKSSEKECSRDADWCWWVMPSERDIRSNAPSCSWEARRVLRILRE